MKKVKYGLLELKSKFRYYGAYYVKYSSNVSINLKTGKGSYFNYSRLVTPVKLKITEVK